MKLNLLICNLSKLTYGINCTSLPNVDIIKTPSFISAVGVGKYPCAITWPGYFAFSDPEAKALADFIMENNVGKWKLYLTLHSYSQLWMTPWGYTQQLPQDYDKMVRSCIVFRGYSNKSCMRKHSQALDLLLSLVGIRLGPILLLSVRYYC